MTPIAPGACAFQFRTARVFVWKGSEGFQIAYTSIIPVHRLDSAVSYVLDENKTSRRKNEASLRREIGRAFNEDKTEQDLFQSAVGCTCETAFADMFLVKQMWHKEGGVQGFHLVQSFAPGELSPELAHQIGLEFAGKLLKGSFQVVITTHLNTNCIHNHLVWNSVSLKDGRKYRSSAKSYRTEIRRISDDLCRQYGLSVIQTERSEWTSLPYAQWLAEREGRPTWKTVIQQDLDEAMAQALTWKQFLTVLKKRGYTFCFDRKYPTLTPPGKERPVRFKTLGRNYTPEAIQRRILSPKPLWRAKRFQTLKFRIRTKPSHSVQSLRALYFSYLYRVGALRRKPRYPSFAVREDIRKLDARIEQMEFLLNHNIKDRGQLAAVRKNAEDEINALVKQRQKLYRWEARSPQITVLTGQIKKLRHMVRLCKKIEIHSVEIEQRMRAARAEEQSRREKERQTNEKQLDRKAR